VLLIVERAAKEQIMCPFVGQLQQDPCVGMPKGVTQD